MAGVISTVKVDSLRPILHHFVAPLVREMVSTEESNATLRRLAKEVSQMLKKRMSEEEYTQLISQAQQKLDKKKAERKTSYAHKVKLNSATKMFKYQIDLFLFILRVKFYKTDFDNVSLYLKEEHGVS